MKALEIKNLVKTYWKNKVLKNIDLSIEAWDFYALLWKNWAWKTTLISIVTDLVYKDSWKVKVFGINTDKNFSKAKKHIWVVPQEFNFNIFDKVINIPVYQAGYYGIPKDVALERTEKLLKELWLWEKRFSEARQLSWGMKRRLMIARALVHNPDFLILDEPTAWVDIELRASTWKFIKKLNKSWTTILLTTHYLEEAEALCNKIAIMNNWHIVEDTSTKRLLSKLDEEIIILNTREELNEIPDDIKKEYKAKLISKTEIEISLKKLHTINKLIDELDKEKIIISSFRNKSSRLEQLFTNIIK